MNKVIIFQFNKHIRLILMYYTVKIMFDFVQYYKYYVGYHSECSTLYLQRERI